MLRSLLRASAAVAFAALIAPAGPSAAPPPGLAYDEIVRVVVSATPPPPGSFQADAAAVNSPAPVATPAPHKRGLGGLVNIAGAVVTGGGTGSVAGAVANEVVASAMDNAIQRSIGAQFAALGAAASGFLQPHLLHYAYWNGWERIDDAGAQTATIRKCDIGQVIRLDLARQTYSVYAPDGEPTAAPAPPPAHRGRSPAADPAQPGTMVADLSAVTVTLPPLRIENQPTTGYDATTTFSSSQSTGSCRDAKTSIHTIEYLSNLTQPTVTSCPLRRPPLPRTAAEVLTTPTGGCKPSFTFHRSGPTPPTTKLALYALVAFAAGPSPAPQPSGSPAPGGIGFLTERGNLKTLGPADAGIFDIPAGFSQAP